MNIIKLYFNTLKHLQIKQIFYLVYFKFKKKYFKKSLKFEDSDFTLNNKKLSKFTFIENDININLKDSYFTFLNQKKKINTRKDWNPSNTDKLWIYNLHYFDYILSSNFLKNKNQSLKLIEDWIDINLFPQGNGWEPYTISLRVVNWIKFFLLLNIKPNLKIKNSLIQQSLFLDKNYEYHILANHIFANIKSTIFFNFFFKSKNSVNKLRESFILLNKEIKIQILNDGYHYEQSPYYHSLVLTDLLDIVNIKKIYGYKSTIKKSLISKMLTSLKKTTHLNGRLASFNDVQHSKKFIYKDLYNYYEKIFNEKPIFSSTVSKKNASGFYNSKILNLNLICFFGAITSNHQPGHSHSSTLSFELSHNKNIVFTNRGISTYNINSKRLYERSSKSYNSLQLQKYNANEVWKSFRVAQRAEVYNFNLTNKNSTFKIEAKHNGFKRFGLIHNRSLKIKENELSIKDKIYGKSILPSYIRFYLNHDIKVKRLESNRLNLYLKNKKLAMIYSSNNISIIDKYQNLEFNKSQKTILLLIKITNNTENHFNAKFN